MNNQPPTHNEPAIAHLAKNWLTAKANEEACRKARVAIEEQMLPFLDQKPEGSITTELPSGHKVTVTNRLNRALNFAGFNKIRDRIPEALRPIKIKELLDDQGVKYLAANEPEIYELIAPHLTVKPAKPGVKVTAPIQMEGAA